MAFHLQLLKNNDYILCVLQYIIVAYLHPIVYSSHDFKFIGILEEAHEDKGWKCSFFGGISSKTFLAMTFVDTQNAEPLL